jgi:hypothetical protein
MAEKKNDTEQIPRLEKDLWGVRLLVERNDDGNQSRERDASHRGRRIREREQNTRRKR